MPLAVIVFLCSLCLSLTGFTHAQSLPDNRCGTLLLLDSYSSDATVSPRATRRAPRYATRPTLPGESIITGNLGHTYTVTPTFYNTPAGHFKIWYVTSTGDRPGAGRANPVDGDNSGVPDWVEKCGEFFETSYSFEVDTLGFRPALDDFQYHSEYVANGGDDGGDARFDVYIQDIGSGIAGYTVPEDVISGRKVPAYIVLDNDYVGVKNTLSEALELLSVTAAHEYFHAIQFGYDFREDTFWLEQTAVWMEDQVFDDVNDYLTYLTGFSGFLTQPWVSLFTANGQHEYGGSLWPIYLSDRYGRSVIRSTWERAETASAIDAIDQALAGVGSSLKSAFREFTGWNAFTNVRANPAQFHNEAVLWPLVTLKDSTGAYPFSGPTDNLNRLPQPLGANFILFKPNLLLPGGLKISFQGLTGEWGVTVAASGGAGADTLIAMPLTSQQGMVKLYNWGSYDTIILVVASMNRTGFTNQYQFTAEYDSTLTDDTSAPGSQVAGFPNPFSLSSQNSTAVKFSVATPGRVILQVYNVIGQQVRTLLDVIRPAGQFVTTWDGRDHSGRPVSSGIYLYRLTVINATGTEQSAVGKMVLLK